MKARIDREFREREEQLRLALDAAGFGTWEMDLVNNRRQWSDETLAMHGLVERLGPDGHLELTDEIMHPEDQARLAKLHAELRAGRDDYAFEYRTTLPNGQQRWMSSRGKVLEREESGPTRIVGVMRDVTTQKQAEQIKENYDARLRLLADSLPQLVWMADAKGQVNFYNARRSAYSNDGQSESLKPLWQPLIHPEDLLTTIATWLKAMRDGSDYEIEHRLKMLDGSFRWHLSRATPVRGLHGEITAWFGTATDIDGMKQAEVRIQGSVERLQLATEAANMFAWEMDFETNKLTWADNTADIIGCSLDDLRSELTEGNFFVHSDDRDRLKTEFEAAWRNGGDRFEMQFRGLPRKGLPVHWRTSGKFIRDRDGLPKRAVGVTQDITRHVESAARVKVLDERLATAEEGAGALVYDWDVLANRVWRSDTVTRVLGWEPSEISPDPSGWQRLVHPDDLARFMSISGSDYLDDKDQYITEYRIRHKDGNYRWVMDTGRVYRNEDGKIIRQAGTTLDVTARKKSDIAQQRMANLIDLSFEPIFVWHPSQGIVEWNKGAELLYGYSRDEALGLRPQDLLQTQYTRPLNEINATLKNLKKWTGEVTNTSKSGAIILVECRYQKIEVDGETVVLETNRDIRERKRADANVARMAAVVSASHDALYGTTLEGFIEAWNPGAERLLGHKESEVLGRHISMLAHADKHAEQLQFLQRVGAGETIRPFDTVRIAKDGRLIEVSMAMSPVKAADGTVIAVSVALHDVSERKEWEARQRLMNKELAHRVNNSFAILQAILRSTLKSSPDPEHFAAAFSGRLHSLAAAHDVLTANDWRGAELGALLRQQLAHYVAGQRVRLVGTAVDLAAEQAAPLSLIINELATNAIKYGALSRPTGRIDISWERTATRNGKNYLLLTWQESGGPPVTSPGRRGFGSTLIEKSLPDATVQTLLKPEGIKFTIGWTVSTPVTAN